MYQHLVISFNRLPAPSVYYSHNDRIAMIKFYFKSQRLVLWRGKKIILFVEKKKERTKILKTS